jgi:hypothetical protein
MVLSMPKRDTPQDRSTGKIAGKRRAIVVPIDSRAPRRRSIPAQKGQPAPVTQTRLAQGYELYLEEMRVTRALREFRMQLEADLAAGAEVEAGDLLFDPEVKIVRRNGPATIANP